MKLDAFLLLQRSDVFHFAKAGHDLGKLPLVFIDPGVVEEAVNQGLDASRFNYRPLTVSRHFHSRIAQEARSRAALIDARLLREREKLFGPGVLQGWDHANFRLFFVRALTARYLGEICDASFAESAIGVFRPTKPQQFYFDSFVATDVFTAGSARWRVVDHYDFAVNWVDESNAASFDFAQIARRAAGGPLHAITHIPTVYANVQHYAREMHQAFAASIDLQSSFWDIPLQQDRLPLVRLDTPERPAIPDVCRVYRERARAVIEAELIGLLTQPHALRVQVDTMADRCLLQAVNYLGLLGALEGTRPHFVLTEHDTGNGGPLFSVAAQLGSDITVLPHSSYPTELLPHALRVTAIERDGFTTPLRTVWGERVAVKPIRLAPRRQPLERPRVATVCLLLNSMTGSGISHLDFVGMVALHKSLVALCAERGVRLLVRLKPNGASLMIASGALGIAAAELQKVLGASIDEVACASDVCIAFGEPTTASIEFLEAGSYFIQAGDQHWPADFLSTPAYLNDATVPALDAQGVLQTLDRLVRDEAHFRHVAQQQRAAFAARLTATDGRLFGAR